MSCAAPAVPAAVRPQRRRSLARIQRIVCFFLGVVGESCTPAATLSRLGGASSDAAQRYVTARERVVVARTAPIAGRRGHAGARAALKGSNTKVPTRLFVFRTTHDTNDTPTTTAVSLKPGAVRRRQYHWSTERERIDPGAPPGEQVRSVVPRASTRVDARAHKRVRAFLVASSGVTEFNGVAAYRWPRTRAAVRARRASSGTAAKRRDARCRPSPRRDGRAPAPSAQPHAVWTTDPKYKANTPIRHARLPPITHTNKSQRDHKGS